MLLLVLSASRQFITDLHSHKGDCDHIMDEVSEALGHLDQLRQKYVKVSTKTNALHEACEHLLAEQVSILTENSQGEHSVKSFVKAFYHGLKETRDSQEDFGLSSSWMQ